MLNLAAVFTVGANCFVFQKGSQLLHDSTTIGKDLFSLFERFLIHKSRAKWQSLVAVQKRWLHVQPPIASLRASLVVQQWPSSVVAMYRGDFACRKLLRLIQSHLQCTVSFVDACASTDIFSASCFCAQRSACQ